MPSQCIVYITDRGYALPALVSALQARVHSDPARTDVVLCLHAVGNDGAVRALERACAEGGVAALRTELDLSRAVGAACGRTGGAPDPRPTGTAVARLFLDELLPAGYDDVVYVDGDTQVTGDLGPLLGHDVPEGKFLAARDYTTLMAPFDPPWAADLSAHLDAVGQPVDSRDDYFNSGVMRASRATWATIGTAALAFFAEHRDRCLFQDQSALNAVAIDRLVPISLRWNFPRHLLYLDLEGRDPPAIVHYSSNPKPWHGAFHPWGVAEHAPYRAILARHPALRPLYPRIDVARRLAYTWRHLRARRARPRWLPSDEAMLRSMYAGAAAL